MVGGFLHLSWKRPSPEQQKTCITNSNGIFNYDPKYHSTSSSPTSTENEASLRKDGFHVNRARVLLGSGPVAFRRAKSALQSWKHFRLGWALVDPDTPVEKGVKFCVCVKEFLPWILMPLQIAYVADTAAASSSDKRNLGVAKASFGFGSGTLHGHLLAGEERFSVEWDENDQVWYQIFSFSKPAHFLSALGYPYVQLRQKNFAQQSTQAVLKHVSSQQSSM